MLSNDLISQAHIAIANAVKDKQYRAIPAIAAGYINAVFGDSLVVGTLAKVHHHSICPGSYYVASPTRIECAPEDVNSIRVPEFEIHVRPVLNIKEDIEYKTVESFIEAISAALDRTYLSLIKNCATWKFANEVDYNRSWTHAIKGSAVREDILSPYAEIIHDDYDSLEHRSMADNEFILIDTSKGIPGTVMISAVRQEPLRSSGLAYRLNDGLLELGFSVKASVMVTRPEAYLIAHANLVRIS